MALETTPALAGIERGRRAATTVVAGESDRSSAVEFLGTVMFMTRELGDPTGWDPAAAIEILPRLFAVRQEIKVLEREDHELSARLKSLVPRGEVVECDEIRAHWYQQRDRLVVVDESLVPDKFKRLTIDKAHLKNWFKETGEKIEGCAIQAGGRVLLVRSVQLYSPRAAAPECNPASSAPVPVSGISDAGFSASHGDTSPGQVPGNERGAMSTLQLGGSYNLDVYHAYWSVPKQVLNPAFDEFSGFILDLKKDPGNRKRDDAVSYFVNRLHSMIPLDWALAYIPSSDPQKVNTGIRQVARDLAVGRRSDATACLVRARAIKSAHSGGSRGREMHLASIRLCERHLIENRNVLLLDDVTTSGGSMNACKHILLAGGASTVTTMALGKTAVRLY